MPRPPRRVIADGYFHVLNRGNGRMTLFHKDHDFDAFLKVLGEGLKRYPVDLLCYCLMSNHWHLVLRPRGASALADFMRWVANLPANAKLPDQVIEVRGFEAHLKKAGVEEDEPEVKLARKVVGKNGYVVVLGNNGVTKGAFLVTIKDDKARVVAIPQ